MESSRISGLQTFHYGRTRIGRGGRGGGGEEEEEKGIAKPENRFACRRKTLSLQRRKCGAKKIRLEINVLENVVSTTEGANASAEPRESHTQCDTSSGALYLSRDATKICPCLLQINTTAADGERGGPTEAWNMHPA